MITRANYCDGEDVLAQNQKRRTKKSDQEMPQNTQRKHHLGAEWKRVWDKVELSARRVV